MMIDRAVVLQALKAMEANRYAVANQAPHGDVMAYNAAAEALRAAVLAQERAEPLEPVAGVVLNEEGRVALVEYGREEWHCVVRNARRLYTAPPKDEPKPMHPELRKMWEDYFDKCFRAMPVPKQAEPVERAMQDAVTTGMGIMRGGERIDPGTIYKPIKGVPV